MKYHPIAPARGGRRRPPFIAWLLAAAALLLSPAADANQVFKDCRKSWVKQTQKLSPDQLAWRLQQRFAEMQRDLDGDGLLDTLTLTNWPSYRDCDLKKTWQKKEVTLKIEFGHGKTRIYDWIDDQLVEKMKVYVAKGKILVVAVDSRGKPNNRWVQYRKAEDPLPGTLLAETRGDPPKAAALRIASVQ